MRAGTDFFSAPASSITPVMPVFSARAIRPISLPRLPPLVYTSVMTQAATQVGGGGENISVKDRVQGVINLIRPAVQADGGDIELVDVTSSGVVQIRFHGACHGCPSSTMTLQMGIERNLRDRVPEVTQVIPVP